MANFDYENFGPSWKTCYFMLTNRILLALAYIELKEPEAAMETLREGREIIRAIENTPWLMAVKNETDKNNKQDLP